MVPNHSLNADLKVGGDSLYLPYSTDRLHSRDQLKKSVLFKRLLHLIVYCFLALCLTTLLSTPLPFLRPKSRFKAAQGDPASEWQDNVWPIRQQTPWDISTDFPYPRVLEYDVSEGTWLRLDVHPKTGDIVFDMVGDLYCLTAREVSLTARANGGATRARPVLRGVPYDSDPHFSPEGDRLVFRSDAGLGVENIWVMPWKGCEGMDLSFVDENVLRLKGEDEELLAMGVVESPERKVRRLLREGRHGARRVTNETYRWLSDARFHPSGSKVIATKWYTSSRSLGAGEGWEYPVPSLTELEDPHSEKPIEVGSGRRVVSRTLPFGWTADRYGDQQIGPEQLVWSGNDTIIYAKNVRDENTFQYSKDVHKGIYAIFQQNITTNKSEMIVDASPGGASRPELSRDGKTLAFVRRVRDQEALVLKDLQTGSIHNVWHGLSYDLSAISAPMGTYPSFAFTPDDSAIIIWAAGQIYSVPLSTNERGERVASGEKPFPIRFIAHIQKRLADTRKDEFDILKLETQDTQRVHAFQELRVDDKAENVVFQAAGVTYLQTIGKKQVTKLPVLHASAAYHSPSFVHGAENRIIHARWSNTNFSSFEIADLENRVAHEIVDLPMGRYFSPILCECPGSQRQIAFVKSDGDYMTGDILVTAKPGLYIAEITLPSKGARNSEKIALRNLHFVPSDIDSSDRLNMRFLEKNKKLFVQQSSSAFVIDLEGGPNENGEYKHTVLASGRMSTELAVSQKLDKKNGYVVENAAFVDFFHVYFAPGKSVTPDEGLWSKPGNATKDLARLSLDGGHDVTWTDDGKRVFWFLGAFLHWIEIDKLSQCSAEIKADPVNFGIACIKNLVQYQEIFVEHSTDIARLKKEAADATHVHKPWLDRQNSDTVVIFNATLLTMEHDKPEFDVVPGGILVVRGGVLHSVGTLENLDDYSGATVINAQKGYVVPGFIDVHAHWEGFSARYPSTSWEMETFLAYGVTTLHNPSADTVKGFVERSRVERGQTIGSRIFTVGDIIYGAGLPGIHQDIVDMAEAHSALARIKAEGGPASISYKNYNIPSRASRQRLLLAARNLTMLCVPEGGMNYDWDLTYILDGMTTVEHAMPVPVLYDDVQILFASSGTGNTPTHIVNYGGTFGEQFVWANYDVPNDPKLRRFTKHDVLEGLTESTARPKSSYQLFNTSASVSRMVEKGMLAHIGAHGEAPLGLNYHAEMFFTKQGGLSNYEVLRAATSSAARTLGLFSSLGSLSNGKLADFIVYPPGVDLLRDDIRVTQNIWLVARGGRIWSANTMEELWPVKGRRQIIPPLNAD